MEEIKNVNASKIVQLTKLNNSTTQAAAVCLLYSLIAEVFQNKALFFSNPDHVYQSLSMALFALLGVKISK